MDFELRKNFINKFQKDANSLCFKLCFNDLKMDKECFDSCVLNFIDTLEVVNNKYKNILLKYNSIYYFKLYNRENMLYSKLLYSENFLPYKYNIDGFFLANDIKNNKKW